MSKRKARCAIAKDGSVWHLSAEEATLAKKPYYNAYMCKSGAHGDCKYNREKEKRDWKRRINVEGTFRGPFPYLWGVTAPTRLAFPALLRALKPTRGCKGVMAFWSKVWHHEQQRISRQERCGHGR